LHQIFKEIGNPSNQNNLKNYFGINADIINTINNSLPQAQKETKQIAKYFKGETPDQTCKKIWLFLRNDIEYKKDIAGYQFIKLPRRFLKEKTGDCKSFSLFGAGILANIYPTADIYLRYSSYSIDKIPSHVYVIMFLNNKFYICDGVYKYFNQEKEYKSKKDHKMKIYTLAGIEDDVISGRKKGKIKAAIKKAAGQVKGAVKKGAAAVKKGGVKKVALAPVRAAFLGLVLTNVKGLASKIVKAHQKDSSKLKNFWEKFGGQYEQLLQTAQKGATKKPIGYIPDEDEEIGSAAAVGTAIATASPIIVQILNLLKSILPKKEFEESGETKDLEEKASKEIQETGAGQETGESAGTGAGAGAGAGAEGSFFEKNKTLILVGAGALALFFVMKKK